MTDADTIKAQLLKSLDSVSRDFGIYPQAVKGFNDERDYEQRDGWKNGWNACVMEYDKKFREALGLYDSPWSAPVQLFAAADGCFSYIDGIWCVSLNDTWYYACADTEEIPLDEYKTVADLFCRHGFDGALYWVFLRRGHLPSIPAHATDVESVRVKEEARAAKIEARRLLTNPARTAAAGIAETGRGVAGEE